MGLIEIIVLGYLFNITVWILIFVWSFIIGLMKMRDEDFSKGFTVLAEINNEIKYTRTKLQVKGISVVMQEDFIVFIPWAGVPVLLKFVWRISSIGFLHHMYIELSKRLELLENRLAQYK